MQNDSRVPGWTFRRSRDRYFLGFALLFCLSLLLALVSGSWPAWIFCGLTLCVFGLVFYFFRDPVRILADRDPAVCYSPADGQIVDILEDFEDRGTGVNFIRIGIFMSVLDVHVQRSPLSGVVDFVSHQAGVNHPAYLPEASTENDQITMGLRTSYGPVLVKQIAGILARKCVNFALPGDEIASGQRYGLIKLGSRVELFLPPGSVILARIGDKVTAGITPIAEMRDV